MKNRPSHIAIIWQQLTKHRFFVIAIVGVVALLVIGLVQWRLSEAAANNFETSLRSYIKKSKDYKLDTSGSKTSVVPKEYTDIVRATPKLSSVPLGGIFSHSYREAIAKQASANEFSKIATNLDAQQIYKKTVIDDKTKFDNAFLKKYLDEINGVIRRAGSISTADRPVNDGSLVSLKKIATSIYDPVITSYDTGIKNIRAIEVPESFRNEADFALQGMIGAKNVSVEAKKQTASSKTFADFAIVAQTYAIDNQKAVSEMGDRFNNLLNAVNTQGFAAASLLLAISEDFDKLSATSVENGIMQAKVAYYRQYAKLTFSFSKEGKNSGLILSGRMKFAQHMTEDAIRNASIDQKDKDTILSLHSATRDAIEWANKPALTYESRSGTYTDIVAKVYQYTGYDVLQDTRETGEELDGDKIETDKARAAINGWIDELPYSPVAKTELDALNEATKEAIGLQIDYVKQSASPAQTLRSINNEYRKLVSKDVKTEADRAKLTQLQAQLKDVNESADKIGKESLPKIQAAASKAQVAQTAAKSALTSAKQTTFEAEANKQFDNYFTKIIDASR